MIPLDKPARLAQEAAAEAAKEPEPEPLEKPFPFKIIPFDPSFFGIV